MPFEFDQVSIPLMVVREAFPLPPTTAMSMLSLSASFRAPQVTVVVPEECQSKPRTQEKAWNQKGSDKRLMYPSVLQDNHI